MIDWGVALTTASHAIKLVQDLRTIDKEISAADLKLRIADLTSSLADLKLTLTEARTEALEKDEEISRLKALHKRLLESTVEAYGYRYRKSAEGKPLGNPLCQVCLEKNNILFETTDTDKSGRPLQCPNCKALYQNVRSFLDE